MASYSQRIDLDPNPGGWARNLGEPIENRVEPIAAQQPPLIDRAPDLHAIDDPEILDQRTRPGAADSNLRPVGWQPKRPPTITFGNGDHGRISLHRRFDDLVPRHTSLDHDSTASTPPSDQSRGLRDQTHGVLGRTLTNDEQFLVEVEEDDDVGSIDAVKNRLGSDGDPTFGVLIRPGSDLVDRLTEQRLEFFACPFDPDPQRLERRRATECTDHRAPLAAVGTYQLLTHQPHDRQTILGPHQLATGRTGEKPCAPRAVQHTHHSTLTIDVLTKPRGEDPRFHRVLVAAVEHIDDRPIITLD